MKTIGKKKYYSLSEAAQFLDESIEDVRQRLYRQEIPSQKIRGETYIPALPLQDFRYDHLSPSKRKISKTSDVNVTDKAIAPLLDKIKSLETELKIRDQKNKKLKTGLLTVKSQFEEQSIDLGQLADSANRNETVTQTLRSEIVNLQQDNKSLVSKLNEEKRRRIEAENLIHDVRPSSSGEERKLVSDLRDNIRGIFNGVASDQTKELESKTKALEVTIRANKAYFERELSREQEGRKQDKLDSQYERDRSDAEIENLSRENQALTLMLEQQKEQLSDAENRAQELYSELEQFKDQRQQLDTFEVEKRTLEVELAEKERRVQLLASEANTLAQIRELIGSTNATYDRSNSEVYEHSSSLEFDSENNEVILFQTQHGIWKFHPPFELEDDEVELLRLVAGEDGMTAEQIRRRTNRKRAVDDLDELLDKLHEHDLEPIKEERGRYSFDQEFLQNE